MVVFLRNVLRNSKETLVKGTFQICVDALRTRREEMVIQIDRICVEGLKVHCTDNYH